jgi:hypothetical protein
MKTKVCRKCELEKDIICFGNKKTSKDGLMNTCKDCEKNRRKEYSLLHPEKLQKSRDSWSQKNPNYKQPVNKEKERERAKQFRKNNPEKHKDIVKKSNIKRRDGIAKYMRKRREEFPEYDIIYSMLTRVIKLKKTTKESNSEKILGWNKEMFIKVVGSRPNNDYHLDHKIPLSAFKLKITPINLVNSLSNLHWIPSFDNLSKNNKYSHPIDIEYFNQIKEYLLPKWKNKINII